MSPLSANATPSMYSPVPRRGPSRLVGRQASYWVEVAISVTVVVVAVVRQESVLLGKDVGVLKVLTGDLSCGCGCFGAGSRSACEGRCHSYARGTDCGC